MSVTFISANGERRVQVMSIDGRQRFVVERKGNLMGHGDAFSGDKRPAWYLVTETTDINVVALHVNLKTLTEA